MQTKEQRICLFQTGYCSLKASLQLKKWYNRIIIKINWLKNKKILWIVFAVGFLVFLSTKIVFASFLSGLSFGSQSSGRIITLTTPEIAEYEMAGYECDAPATSLITIKPFGSSARTPTSYYIPPYTRSKTGNTPRIGQLIMGKYGGKHTVYCILDLGDYIDIEAVNLDIITLFGNSR